VARPRGILTRFPILPAFMAGHLNALSKIRKARRAAR
jgi:hypothetical protein